MFVMLISGEVVGAAYAMRSNREFFESGSRSHALGMILWAIILHSRLSALSKITNRTLIFI